jgi:hypothetical protein
MAGYPLGDIRRVYLKKLERNILTEESTCGTMEIWKKALLL